MSCSQRPKNFILCDKQGVAYIKLRTIATRKKLAKEAQVLLDDKDWAELQARFMYFYMSWGNQILLKLGDSRHSFGLLALQPRPSCYGQLCKQQLS